MPNWVKTIVKTKPKVLNDILKNYWDKDSLSFDKIIPMPKDLDIESGGRGEEGLMYLFVESKDDLLKLKINRAYRELNPFHTDIYRESRFGEIEDNFEKYTNDPEFSKSIELGKKYISNFEKYGHSTWYNWRVENWGTKWDIDESPHNEDTIIFKTAWDFAGEIIKELSKKYPNEKFICKFADEGIKENSGIVDIKNGEIESERYNLSMDEIEDIWGTYIEEIVQEQEEIEIDI